MDMVFWEPHLGRFRTANGREFKRPSKVFRYSFQNQHSWTDSIKPVTGGNFLLEQLKHDHWTDATADHTNVTNIVYTLPDSVRSAFAYICVFNYGQWKPVYWGITGKQNQVCFPTMGCHMLYRVAVPKSKKYTLLNDIFMVDSTAQIQRLIPDETNLQDIELQKINHGERAWVEAGKTYALYMLERNAEWRLLQTKTCQRDSLIHFDHVPGNALYRLLDEDAGENRLERIFTYNEKQNWW